MKRPIDIEHATKWLVFFSVVALVFSVLLFCIGSVPGGIALLIFAIILFIPKIKKIFIEKQETQEPTIKRNLKNKLEDMAEEEIKKPLKDEDKE